MNPGDVDFWKAICSPPGCGWATSSSGFAPLADPILRTRYHSVSPIDVERQWVDALVASEMDEPCVVGVPFDGGTLGVKGAAFGPTGIRCAWTGWEHVTDLGDITVLPGANWDEDRDSQHLRSARAGIYGSGDDLHPISPLSRLSAASAFLAERSVRTLFLGGDHLITAAIATSLLSPSSFVLHIDQHDDLGLVRPGYGRSHANWLRTLGGSAKLARVVQVGVGSGLGLRSSGDPHLQISGTTQGSEEALDHELIVSHMQRHGCDGVYVTVDIDCLPHHEAPSTGLPNLMGISAYSLIDLIEHVAAEFPIVGGDIVEVAPVLRTLDSSRWAADPTCCNAALIGAAILSAMRRR